MGKITGNAVTCAALVSSAWQRQGHDTQIASISGHGIDYCQRIIDTYLPRRTEVAIAGMQLWEQHQERETSKVVSIAATRGRLG
ncbi:hypothetical protein KTQ54_14795 [Komagataeibacter oboediens]|uniref:hypothetical protein n=1 Tax=Komagataeibacter oboediens TaxID=65958 RepID=UPI001C2C886B|nr:hypothetical protein [Komagataeibacter oboediens]MBV0889782.1 hypothetical protein [Komagataeibacter oboediens]MCK9818637.1 hypothetical protein [Komagataeibacter oboediens]